MKLAIFSNILHKLRIVEQRLTKKFEEDLGFSLTRYQILIFLRDNGDKLQVDIANYLGIDPAAVTRHIKILETKGYINKRRSEHNGREVIVSLTDFAKKELEKCSNQQNDCENALSFSFTQEEIIELTEILDRIENRL